MRTVPQTYHCPRCDATVPHIINRAVSLTEHYETAHSAVSHDQLMREVVEQCHLHGN